MSSLSPRGIVSELNRHIVGQENAKKAVALALRNRWRRMQLPEEMRAEVAPKNILMIGPTGVGKTEIARRLAKLADAPFLKIEATKFTEVGYVGRDVESIIRDLMEVAIKLLREKEMARVRHKAEDAAEDRVLDALLPNARGEQAFVCFRRGAFHTAHPTPVPSAVPQRACRAQPAPFVVPTRAVGGVPIFPVARFIVVQQGRVGHREDVRKLPFVGRVFHPQARGGEDTL